VNKLAYPEYPETEEEWWQLLDENWKWIKNIIAEYYPNKRDFPKDGWPVNIEPQRSCNAVIKRLREEKPIWESTDHFRNYIEVLKIAKDVKLLEILNITWFGIPEQISSRELPGFYVFCDLCSEGYVLEE